jgi:uncharacterized protein (DUF1778 family)
VCWFIVVKWREKPVMPPVAVEEKERIALRVRSRDKALLLRAATQEHADLTAFVLQHALRAAKSVIEEAEHIQLSRRDSLRVSDLLENPPAPNAKLLAAAKSEAALKAAGKYERG